MRRFACGVVICLLVATSLAVLPSAAAQQRWSWQQAPATVLPTGDLEWDPEPFEFVAGDSVRYIDFAGGDDANDGLSTQTPWQHHPWDPNAADNAAACSGPHTYLFKRGVIYRGALESTESGAATDPIHLTSDPSWGEGQAMLYGSERISGGWSRCTAGDAPEGMAEAAKVWYADLPDGATPRCLWMVGPEEIVRLKLARTPNWQVSDPQEIKSEWWEWENPEWWKAGGHKTENPEGKRIHLGIDTEHLTEPADYYQDALVWTEYGIMMGTPFASRVETVDTEQNAIGFQGVWYGDSGQIIRGNRYYLENKPHYLDEPGEFYYAEDGPHAGRLYVRLPGDADPNETVLEAARRYNLIDMRGVGHVHVSGLTFRFTNVWDLPARGFVHEDVDCACVRMLGSGEDIQVRNCRFEHVNKAVRIKAVGDTDYVDDVVVADNEILHTDHGAISVSDGARWGKEEPPKGELGRVAVLRNRLHRIGLRPIRSGHGHAVHVGFPAVAEIAGNILHRCYGAGLFMFGGKGSGYRGEAPLARLLVHHNKVTDPLLNTNDWGGVETWQGGPWYVYNNVSGNPGGYMNWRYNPDKPGSARFAHAYYMDGSFKNYQFNNIAWGRNNDPSSKYCNTSAFQEIISYQNTVFNNTVFRFFKGTRRQKPEAGRDKFLGNIWQDISGWVFWHAKPTDAEADPNVYQIGETGETFAYHTNAYADNIFHSIAGKIGVFEASGVPRPELEQMRKALQMHDAMAASVGVQAEQPPLRDAEAHDFRPAAGSAAIGRGVRVFVPWALYAMVGEWNFTRNNADPTVVIDEHWYMTPYHVGREQYWTRPTYPLEAVNVDAEDYVAGPLEDWTQGALRLNGQDQYLVLSDEQIDEPFRLKGQAVEGGWATVTLPTAAVPGEPFDVVVELAEPHEGQQVAVHLHWLKKAGFGGFNAWGGLPKAATSVGPHTFTFTAEDKPDLATFSATVFLSPTGDWGDRTMVDRIHIEKGQSGSEPETREVALGGEQATRWITVSGQDLKTPETYNSSFLIEAYFRTDAGASGVLVEKMGDAGYSVLLDDDGLPRFSVRHGDAAATVRGKAPLNDGEWHHLIAEADREAGELRLYLDGALNATTDGLGSWSLANKADLHVGGTPDGRCLAAELEFVRIARGTLADARTTIEELHEWQFNGPFLRDFTGREPVGKREAGALELTE